MKRYKSIFDIERKIPVDLCSLIESTEKGDCISPLLENTFNIDKDVDLLYQKSELSNFVKLYQDFKKDKLKEFPEIYKKLIEIGKNKEVVLKKLNSSIFKTEDCIKANNINPIHLYIGVFDVGSSYMYKKNRIQINIDIHVLNNIQIFYKYSYSVFKKTQKVSELREMESRFSENGFKETLYHELSHWLQDSLFNRIIKNTFEKAKIKNKSISDYLEKQDVDMTYFEINAQVHAIKQLKRYKSKEWDNLSMNDLFFEYPRLRAIYIDLYKRYDIKVANIWVRYLVERLHREKLLGKNMKGFPDLKSLREQIKKKQEALY